MKKPLSSLSIFFPAYRDEHTIEDLVRKALAVGKELTDDLEILVVDDCSPDRVGEIADRLAEEFPQVRAIHHPVNRGVGAAMVTGFTQAQKDYVFYTDGDAQYDLEELKTFVPYASQFDAVIGYRLSRAEGWFRVFTSRVFHLLMLVSFGLRFKDIDASFKLIHQRILKKIRFRTASGLIDAELLIQIKSLGCPIQQVGVHHYPRKFGRSTCLNPGVVGRMLRDILRLRWMYWFGA